MLDYYKILEISRDATQEEIRRAYRRLALRCHPDKNCHNLEEAERKFREISEAYEVLSDDRRRQTYDRCNIEGVRPHTGQQPENFQFRSAEDIFKEFFRNSDILFGFPTTSHMFGAGQSQHRSTFANLSSAFSSADTNSGSVTAVIENIKIKDGKTVVTKKVVENGVETVTVHENGVLKKKTVKGDPKQMIRDGKK